MSERESAHHGARAALERSLTALAVGIPQAADDRNAALEDFAAAEMDQYVHYRLRGSIGRDPAWHDIDLVFPYPFLSEVDPNATDTTLRVPHFVQPGVEWKNGPDIVVNAILRAWVRDEYGLFTGATMRLAVSAPRAGKVDPIEAVLHFTFSGYAAPTEDDSQG